MTDEGGKWVAPYQVAGIDQVTINDRVGAPVLRFEAYRASVLGFEFGLIPTHEAKERLSSSTPAPTVGASGTDGAGSVTPVAVECAAKALDGAFSYECVTDSVSDLSSLTLTVEWPTLDLQPTDIPVAIRALHDAVHLSENPPNHIPPGYGADGKRIPPQ